MNNSMFLIMFVIYVLAMIALGWYVSRNQKTGDDFLLGGRSMPFFLILGSTVATMVGTGSSMGAVGFGYLNGWAGMLYGIGGALGILLVGWWFAPVRELRFMTMSEEISYYVGANKIVKNIVGVMIFLACIGWLGAHIIGGSLYLAWAANISMPAAKIIIAVAFSIYVVIGGYAAVCWTDTIQAIILFFGFILMAVLSVIKAGGWSAIEQALDPAALSLFGVDKVGLIPAISLAFVIGVGVIATPSYRQRIYSADSVKSVRRSFVLSGGLYLFFAALPAIIGMATYAMNPTLTNNNNAFLEATKVFPTAIAIIILIAGLSAVMSSASSDAIAGVSVMMRDLYTMVKGKMPPEDKAITLSRIYIVVVVGMALAFALTSNDIIKYITMMVSTLLTGLAACGMLGRFWKPYTWQGAIATIIGGSVTSIAISLSTSLTQYWGNPSIPSIIVALIMGVVVTLLSPKKTVSEETALAIITAERENTGTVVNPLTVKK